MVSKFFKRQVVAQGESVVLTLARLATVITALCGSGAHADQPIRVIEGQFQNSRYEALSYATGISWDAASANCQARGGRLADILSREENEFITTQLLGKITWSGRFYLGAWMGYTDAQKEGSWIWTSGQSSSYKNFGAGEPNNGVMGNCGSIELQRSTNPNGWWNDDNCASNASYEVALCEYYNPCKPATYEAATGIITIPALNIEGLSTSYQGKLKQAMVSLLFSVFGSVTPSTVSSGCPATYSATTGKLILPVVKSPNPIPPKQDQCYRAELTQFYNRFDLDSISVISCP